MKKIYTFLWFVTFILTVITLLYGGAVSAQVPQGFNYQAIARGSDGKEIANATIKVRLSILSDTNGFKANGTGVYVWEEEHINVKTNAFGLFTVVMGNPLATKVQGSATAFSSIAWMTGSLFIGTKIANPTTYKILGSARLWTVPYSMVAGSVSGPLNKLAVNGTTSLFDEALFEVRNRNGQIVFAVYNEGIRAYVDNGSKAGAKGGFAIGGFGTDKAVSQPLMVISPDSARIFFDETKAKGAKGGFAIGGFNSAKGVTSELLFMSPENYFIGHSAGKLVTVNALYNSILGYQSGKSLTDGDENVFMGYMSGYSTTLGYSNVFIGTSAGFSNTTGYFNILLGRQSGYKNTEGHANIIIGDWAGHENTTGNDNVMVGDYAGGYNTTGLQNVFIGANAGLRNTIGSYNTYLGSGAGYSGSGSTGSNNIFMGVQAGYSNYSGYDNIAIGNLAGHENFDGIYNVMIGSSAGRLNTSGRQNVFIGPSAGFRNTTGNFNTYLGYNAGYSGISATGSNNIFMGVQAGYSNISGFDNIAIGNLAGYSNVDGTYNVMIGSNAGNLNVSGDYNTMIGYKAGESQTANYATLLGYLAGNSTSTGDSQTLIGYEAGRYNTGAYNTMLGVLAGGSSGSGWFNTYLGIAAGNEATGSNNVFIGKWAGWRETGSSKLVIETSYSDADNYNNALIYGDFVNRYLRFNGGITTTVNKASGYAAAFLNLGNTTSNWGIKIQSGNSSGTGDLIDFYDYDGTYWGSISFSNGTLSMHAPSDKNLKQNVKGSTLNGIKTLRDLPVVEYSYIKAPDVRHNGYIAQDALKVFPEMVKYKASEETYTISSSALIPVLHKAIIEQQGQIEAQARRIEELEKMVKQLMSK